MFLARHSHRFLVLFSSAAPHGTQQVGNALRLPCAINLETFLPIYQPGRVRVQPFCCCCCCIWLCVCYIWWGYIISASSSATASSPWGLIQFFWIKLKPGRPGLVEKYKKGCFKGASRRMPDISCCVNQFLEDESCPKGAAKSVKNFYKPIKAYSRAIFGAHLKVLLFCCLWTLSFAWRPTCGVFSGFFLFTLFPEGKQHTKTKIKTSFQERENNAKLFFCCCVRFVVFFLHQTFLFQLHPQ